MSAQLGVPHGVMGSDLVWVLSLVLIIAGAFKLGRAWATRSSAVSGTGVKVGRRMERAAAFDDAAAGGQRVCPECGWANYEVRRCCRNCNTPLIPAIGRAS